MSINTQDKVETSGLQPELVNIDSVQQASPFKDLFKIQPAVLESITEDMKINGFDPAFPVLILRNGTLLDGHTRCMAAENVGIKQLWGVRYNPENTELALRVAIASQLDRRRSLTDSDVYRLVTELDKALPPDSGSVPNKTVDLIGPYGAKVKAVRYINAHVTPEIREQVESGKLSISQAARACREASGEIKKRKSSDKPRYGKIIKLLDSAIKLAKTDDCAQDVSALKDRFEAKLADQEVAKLAAKAARKTAREAAKAAKEAKKSGQIVTTKPIVKNYGKVA